MAEVEIQNIVASLSFETTLDLNAIYELLENVNYNPEKFPGLIYRLKTPKCTMLIFRNGKVVCSGAKKYEHIQKSIIKLGTTLAKIYPDIEKSPKIKIQNVVGTYDIGYELSLTRIALEIGLEQVEYEPEQFPGLIYRMKEPKVVMLLFSSGKIVITGGKSIKEMDQAGKNIHELLTTRGLIS